MPDGPPDWNARYARKDTPWDSGRPSTELVNILEGFEISPCRTLELGCGTGTNAVYLAAQGFDVTAVDISPLAIEQARAKASAAGVNVDFSAVDLLELPDLGSPFTFILDRGVYHIMRRGNVTQYVEVLSRVLAAGGWYLTLAGNANDPTPIEGGPPRVTAEEICRELTPLMELVQLREIQFDDAVIDGKQERPLAWSALFRRKAVAY